MSAEVNLKLVECLEIIETIHDDFTKLYQFVDIDDIYRVIHKPEDLREAKKLIAEAIKIISLVTGTPNPVQLRFAFFGAFLNTIKEELEQIPYYKKKKLVNILKGDLNKISYLENNLESVIKVLKPSETPKPKIEPSKMPTYTKPSESKLKLASYTHRRRVYASSYAKVEDLLKLAIFKIKNFKTAINVIIDLVV